MKNPEFIVHGNSSSETADRIRNEGFNFEEGRETVSRDFFFGLDWASNPDNRIGTKDNNPVDNKPGSLFVMKVPDGYKIKYGKDTSINHSKNTIEGHVGKFTGGRKQLGIYSKSSENNINPENQIIEIKATPELVEKAEELKKELFSLGMSIDEVSEKIFNTIKQSIEHNVGIDDSQLKEVLRNLIENSLINFAQEKIRSLYLKLQKIKGVEIKDVDLIPGISYEEVSREEVKKEIDSVDYHFNTLQKSTQIPSLDRYIKQKIAFLKKEL